MPQVFNIPKVEHDQPCSTLVVLFFKISLFIYIILGTDWSIAKNNINKQTNLKNNNNQSWAWLIMLNFGNVKNLGHYIHCSVIKIICLRFSRFHNRPWNSSCSNCWILRSRDQTWARVELVLKSRPPLLYQFVVLKKNQDSNNLWKQIYIKNSLTRVKNAVKLTIKLTKSY